MYLWKEKMIGPIYTMVCVTQKYKSGLIDIGAAHKVAGDSKYQD